MEFKTCKVCNQSKSVDKFGKDKTVKTGLRTSCQICINYRNNQQRKLFRINNPKEVHKRDKLERIQSKERIKNNNRRWYKKAKCDPEKNQRLLDNQKRWLLKHPEYSIQYYIKNQNKIVARRRKNKSKVNEWRKIWLKNPQNKLIHSVRVRVRHALQGKYKRLSCSKLVGCDLNFLKYYLESKFKIGMSWDNYGRFGWHIDHIRPCVNFDLSKIKEQKICFHYTNLQPMWWIENIKKGKKLYGI